MTEPAENQEESTPEEETAEERASKDLAQYCVDYEFDPLEFIVLVAKGEWGLAGFKNGDMPKTSDMLKIRMDAAKLLMPYRVPRKKPEQHKKRVGRIPFGVVVADAESFKEKWQGQKGPKKEDSE